MCEVYQHASAFLQNAENLRNNSGISYEIRYVALARRRSAERVVSASTQFPQRSIVVFFLSDCHVLRRLEALRGCCNASSSSLRRRVPRLSRSRVKTLLLTPRPYGLCAQGFSSQTCIPHAVFLANTCKVHTSGAVARKEVARFGTLDHTQVAILFMEKMSDLD